MRTLDEAVAECPAIAIIRASSVAHAPAVLEALVAGGVRARLLALPAAP
jgi:2-keto-3-deoxy-6-phosphogluconate aldolase